MNMEFDKVVPENPDVVVNMSAASDHVAEAEDKSGLLRKGAKLVWQ